MTPRTSRGFTLVEVLIASTILFATITVISESYRASIAASERSERLVEMLTPVPLIVGHVKNQLVEAPNEFVKGQGKALGVSFEFEARSLGFGAPPPRLEPESGEVRSYAPRFRLYEVKLTLRAGRQKRALTYQELAWLSNAV